MGAVDQFWERCDVNYQVPSVCFFLIDVVPTATFDNWPQQDKISMIYCFSPQVGMGNNLGNRVTRGNRKGYFLEGSKDVYRRPWLCLVWRKGTEECVKIE
jgi:hypothetical protein